MSCGLHKNEYFYGRTGITCIYIDVILKKNISEYDFLYKKLIPIRNI